MPCRVARECFAQETTFRVPATSLGYWTHRLVEKGVEHGAIDRRFDEPVLTLADPDGMRLALVGVEGAENEKGWSNGDVSAEHAIRGFHGITLMLAEAPDRCHFDRRVQLR